MFDVSSVLSAMGGVGLLTFGQQTIKYVRDERRKKVESAQAEARAPIVAGSAWLGMVDQTTQIQQRAIATLNGQVQGLEDDIVAKDARIVQLQHEKAAAETRIRSLYETIGQLEEMNRHGPP